MKTAFVFPGQGSQKPGLMSLAPENDDLDRLLDAAEALSGLDLRSVAENGPDETLADTRYAQPLLYLADWAWGVALLDCGLEPSGVAGHSLGELAALAVGGVFSVEAGLELVVERSRLMWAATQGDAGGMSAVLGMDSADIERALDGIADVWIANDNAPGQVVVTGASEALAIAEERLREAGARRIVRLNVAGAFQSPFMSQAKDRFADILRAADFRDSWVPVYSNTEPVATTDAETIRERLISQMVEPVRWTTTMNQMIDDGIELIVEAGPGSVLSGLVKRVEGIEAISVDTTGIQAVLEKVAR